jgi:hypothetical protein
MISMIDLDQARERRERADPGAALRRRGAAVPVDPPVHRSPMIRIGERVAAEAPALARHR